MLVFSYSFRLRLIICNVVQASLISNYVEAIFEELWF